MTTEGQWGGMLLVTRQGQIAMQRVSCARLGSSSSMAPGIPRWLGSWKTHSGGIAVSL
jgi:hypothetical protein